MQLVRYGRRGKARGQGRGELIPGPRSLTQTERHEHYHTRLVGDGPAVHPGNK